MLATQWTDAQEERLMILQEAGMTFRDIAYALGVSETSVLQRFHTLREF